ncbi:MAG TPA: 50S ribosomal protein L21 [Candidatus Omnitrophota bacterium]|nr:50S ribosomal protein L21 [Candidatus Omnitrophota bacterium]HRZ15580.1 50S ribosomal protein L21 [Candidatus Omnitrophota bacterium]
MFAVIALGGKQQMVKEGDIIDVEKQEAEKGAKLHIKDVLLVVDGDDIRIGQPYVKDASVEATVVRQIKADKVVTFKYRRRKSSHTTKGHRQQLTKLEIKKIVCA